MTGTITWLEGDCRAVMPALGQQFDAIITDPPYGTTRQSWDTWPEGWLKLAAACTRSLWCFGSARMFLERGPEFTAAGWHLAEDIVWEKQK